MRRLLLPLLLVAVAGLAGGPQRGGASDDFSVDFSVKLLERWLKKPLRERPLHGLSGYGFVSALVVYRLQFEMCTRSGALFPYCALDDYDGIQRAIYHYPFFDSPPEWDMKEQEVWKDKLRQMGERYLALLKKRQTEIFWSYVRAVRRAHVGGNDPVRARYVFEVAARLDPERFELLRNETVRQWEEAKEHGDPGLVESLREQVAWADMWVENGQAATPRPFGLRIPRGSLSELGPEVGEKLASCLADSTVEKCGAFRDAFTREVERRSPHLAAPLALSYYMAARCFHEEPGDQACSRAWRNLLADPENELVWLLIKAKFYADYDTYFDLARLYGPKLGEMSEKELEFVRFVRDDTVRDLRARIEIAHRLSPRRFEQLRREVLTAKPGEVASLVVKLFQEFGPSGKSAAGRKSADESNPRAPSTDRGALHDSPEASASPTP